MFFIGTMVSSVCYARTPLDPQNRAHAGVATVNGTQSYGFSAGLDSRLTRFIYIDIGGFGSLTDSSESDPTDSKDVRDWVTMRHGIWAAPGFRIPHAYGNGLNWDVFVRSGFGIVWSEDASDDDATLASPTLIGGLDFLLHKGTLGARISTKANWYQAFPFVAWTESWDVRDLNVMGLIMALEITHQW